jgi:hypothetical protein
MQYCLVLHRENLKFARGMADFVVFCPSWLNHVIFAKPGNILGFLKLEVSSQESHQAPRSKHL